MLIQTQIWTILINSLFFTILLELGASLLLKVRDKRDLLNITLVNIVTNPIVVLFPYLIGFRYGNNYRYILLIFLEVFALLFEGFVYKKYLHYKNINPYVLSLILNVTSYLIGSVINSIIY